MAETTPLVQDLTINSGYVHVKFERTIKVSSITNARFTVQTNVATPVSVSDPFETISLKDHYNSISRELTLYWKSGKLVADSAYTLTFTGLLDSAGATIPNESYNFTTGATTTPTEDETEDPRDPDIEIIDYSVDTTGFSESSPEITGTNAAFHITGTDPTNGDYFIDEDHNNGRITIKFNKTPSTEFVNSGYFKAQRKKLQRAPSRWASLTTHVSLHSSKPWVYVDFPSTDATPVYTTANKDYFEEGYKYRIIVSKDIST